MATLIVGGVTVAVARADQPEEHVAAGGEIVRMFDNSARTTVRSYKRTWTITTAAITDSAATTLKAALLTTTLPVACSGDITGSVNCIPQVKADTATPVNGVLYRRVQFALVEV